MPSPAQHVGNLPAELTSFVGRRHELSEAKRLLSTSRLLTLTGVGGVGKTRLAVRVAADVRRAFPDGVWFVGLAELREASLLPNTIGTVLGLQDGLTAHMAGLAGYLEDKRLLLVLDNCEHIAEGCAVLAVKLLSATSGVRVLATSRQILRAEGEQVQVVPPLPVPDPGPGPAHRDAVTLFAERAAAVAPDFEVNEANRETVARICRRLDGIPLAIELAAVQLRVLSLEQILRRLDDRFGLLTAGGHTAAARQRTLEATIDWSFDLCSAAERSLWASLSVFPGGFDLDAAEAMCAGDGVDHDEVLDALAGLVDKSILLRHRGTYGHNAWYLMLETVREYGQLRLTDTGRDKEIRARYTDYYGQLAREYRAGFFSPRQLELVTRLRREHPNIRMALEICLADPGRVRAATKMAAALGNYWYFGGSVREGYHWLTKALELDTEPTWARAEALWAGSFIATQVGETDAARWMVSELRALAERFDNDILRVAFAQMAGQVKFYSGDYRGARPLIEEALAGCRAADVAFPTFNSLILLSTVTFLLDDPSGATAAEDALSLAETHGAVWSKNYALCAVAAHEWRSGGHRRAATLLREAIGMRLSDQWQLATSIEILAWCASSGGQHARAAGLLGAASAVARLSGAFSPFQSVDEQCAALARAAMGNDAFSTVFGEAAAFDLDQAIAYALDEKKPDPRPAGRRVRGSGPGGLTRREREIAELVAEGLSNKEIAARLVIAQRTAETHVENILNKLGFTSRTQIAAWRAEHRADNDS